MTAAHPLYAINRFAWCGKCQQVHSRKDYFSSYFFLIFLKGWSTISDTKPKRKRQSRIFLSVYYDHLLMVGEYAITSPKTGEIINAKLTPADILLFDRIYSFYECRLDCYETNAEFAKQLGFCEATVSKHINNLKKIGLIKTYTERKYNGRIKDKRYIYVQPERMEQIVAARKKAAKEENPYDCLLLPDLEETEQQPERREAPIEK